MTQITLAPRRPKGDGTEPVLTGAYFQYRLAVSTIDASGQAVKNVWSDPVRIDGAAVTINLDPGTYEGILVGPDNRGNPKGFVESSFRVVPVSGSAILWENLTQTSAPTVPSFATITQANLDALRADLNARMDAIEAGGVGGGAPAGTGVGGRYKPEDLEGVGSTGVAVAKAANPAAARTAIDAPATSHTHPLSQISGLTGTPDSTKALFGDGVWRVPPPQTAAAVAFSAITGTPADNAALDAVLDGLAAADAALDGRLDVLELAGGSPSSPTGTQTLMWDGTTYGTYDTSKLRHDFWGGPDPLTLSNYASLLTAFDTWTVPDTPDPTTGDPNQVTIGSASFPLASTNGPRGNNELVAYTYSASQTSTPTNQYGIEVVVDAATKAPVAVYDRFTNTRYTATTQASFTGTTPISSGQYVLSGHGNIGQTGYAGDWLWQNLTKDVSGARRVDTAKVVQLVVATTPAPTPDPGTPVPAGALPAKVNSVWHHRWAGPNLSDYPESVKASLDLVVLALAQSGGAGTGNLSYAPNNGQSVAAHAADCKAFIARGINVIMGFGGSSDGGITITNTAQADQAFASFASFRSTYGITGIDIDLEPSGSTWTQDAIVYLVRRLKQTYGAGFIVGVTPGLYSPHTTRWMALAQALGSDMDYMAPMLYDFPEAGDSRLTSVALDKCNTMSAAGIPDSKMILGFMLRPPAESYPNSTPTTTLMTNAINAVKAARPNLRGAFIWEDKIQAARSWDGTLAIRSSLPRS